VEVRRLLVFCEIKRTSVEWFDLWIAALVLVELGKIVEAR
jgi:hypothetical protein